MNGLSGTPARRVALVTAAMLAVSICSGPARAADDLPIVGDIPMPEVNVDVRIGDDAAILPPAYPVPRRQMIYPHGPFAAIPPSRYEADVIERPAVSPQQVAVMLRSTGYSLLGGINRRGWVYTVAVLNPRGDDGRAVIDARTGAIIRFIPAFAVNARLEQELGVIYGPPGAPPPEIYDNRRMPSPPVGLPRNAQGPTQYLPKPNGPKLASRAPASTSAAAPAATRLGKPALAPGQQTASVPPKSVEAPVQPPAVELRATQDMPAVQALD